MSTTEDNGKIDLFDKFIDEDNFYKAYKQTLQGDNKYHKEAMEFALNETYNLNKLRQSLIDETYEFDGYIHFTVYEPKERIIDAPHYKDKIVQIALINILKEIYYPTFIYDSYSCIENKGTHKCVDKIHHFLKKAKWEYGEDAFIIKIDIRKFYYTINRDILKKFFLKEIKSKKLLKLLFKIIDSANIIDKLGLPLGNSINTLNSNIYMNKVDQFAKRKLRLKYYIRYADDIVIVVKNKEEAKYILKLLIEFINSKLSLNINENKTKIFPINQGINSIGFKTYTTHLLLRDKCKRKIKMRIKSMKHLIEEDKMTVDKAEQMLNSWKGHATHANNYNFTKNLINRYEFIYKDDKNKLKIDTSRLNLNNILI